MKKTPYANFVAFPVLGIGCIVCYFIFQTVSTAPIREAVADLNRETEIEKARITSEKELLDHRLNAGLIGKFDQFVAAAYIDNERYPPEVHFDVLDPERRTFIYDRFGICVGFALRGTFYWKYHNGQLTDVCQRVAPIETPQTRVQERQERQQFESDLEQQYP